MPKDTRPSQPASTSFNELAKHAVAVNTLTDNLRTAIESVDAALRKLNLGITTWVNVKREHYSPDTADTDIDIDIYDGIDLGYAKVEGTWGIAVRHESGPSDDPVNITRREWLFNDAPRALRLEAIDGLPKLLEQLTKDVQEFGARIFDKVKIANAFATDILASAEELGLLEQAADRKGEGR